MRKNLIGYHYHSIVLNMALFISECESVRSGTPVKLDDVSGYGTADSCSDKTPPYLPTNRVQQQQPFDNILREDSRTDFSTISSRSPRVGKIN